MSRLDFVVGLLNRTAKLVTLRMLADFSSKELIQSYAAYFTSLNLLVVYSNGSSTYDNVYEQLMVAQTALKAFSKGDSEAKTDKNEITGIPSIMSLIEKELPNIKLEMSKKDKTLKKDKIDKTDKIDQTDKKDKTDKTDKIDKTDRTDRTTGNYEDPDANNQLVVIGGHDRYILGGATTSRYIKKHTKYTLLQNDDETKYPDYRNKTFIPSLEYIIEDSSANLGELVRKEDTEYLRLAWKQTGLDSYIRQQEAALMTLLGKVDKLRKDESLLKIINRWSTDLVNTQMNKIIKEAEAAFRKADDKAHDIEELSNALDLLRESSSVIRSYHLARVQLTEPWKHESIILGEPLCKPDGAIADLKELLQVYMKKEEQATKYLQKVEAQVVGYLCLLDRYYKALELVITDHEKILNLLITLGNTVVVLNLLTENGESEMDKINSLWNSLTSLYPVETPPYTKGTLDTAVLEHYMLQWI